MVECRRKTRGGADIKRISLLCEKKAWPELLDTYLYLPTDVPNVFQEYADSGQTGLDYMEENDFASLIYLSVLAAVILGSVLISRRGELGKVFRQAGVWLLILVGVVAIVTSWQDIRQSDKSMSFQKSENGSIIIPKEVDGHYHLTLTINDRTIDFLVDTGASDIVLTRQDAARVGFDPDRLDYWPPPADAVVAVLEGACTVVFQASVNLEAGSLNPHAHRDPVPIDRRQ